MLKAFLLTTLVVAPVCVRPTQAINFPLVLGNAAKYIYSEADINAAELDMMIQKYGLPPPGTPPSEMTKVQKDAFFSPAFDRYHMLIDLLEHRDDPPLEMPDLADLEVIDVDVDEFIRLRDMRREEPTDSELLGDTKIAGGSQHAEKSGGEPSIEGETMNYSVPINATNANKKNNAFRYAKTNQDPSIWEYPWMTMCLICLLEVVVMLSGIPFAGYIAALMAIVVSFYMLRRFLRFLWRNTLQRIIWVITPCCEYCFVKIVAWWLLDDTSSVEFDRSKLLARWNRITVRPETYRTMFMDMPLTRSRPAPAHSHPEAAADRSGASLFIDRLARASGLEAYYVQRSRSDERAGRQGSREYYWVKDLNVAPVELDIPANALIVMVDVDQYVDMPRFLTQHAQPMVLYTFQPHSVSRNASNYSFTFDTENQVHYHVTGGGKFCHVVWNYSTDHMVAVEYYCGIAVKSVAYLIDRRQTSADHELVFLTPLGSWDVWGSYILGQVYGRKLERLKIHHDGFSRLQILTNSGMATCTGKSMSYACALVPTAVDDTIATIARTSKYDLTMAQVLSFVDGDRLAAAALYEYHFSKVASKPDVVCPVPEAVRRYQFDPKNYEPAAKPSLHAFMTPLVHGAFAPDRTTGNEIASIEGRVEGVKPPILDISPFLTRTMKEFVEQLIPDSGVLDPVGVDVVLERQGRPTQRRILAVSEWLLPKRVVNMFMKAEAYPNVKDPRAISQINGVDKRDYSSFIYALDPIMKSQKWYAFGKNPRQIALRVAEVASQAESCVNTDFSKFDGHGSNVMRELEQQVLMRAFRARHHPALIALHRSQYGIKAVGAFGTWYSPEFSRLSGSPETSVMNSIVNAFVAFLALRMSRNRDGSFKDQFEAYEQLGIYGGDDGLTANVDPATYQRAASSIGQELTCEPVQRGKLGIKFLARIYSPYVWFGDPNSMCDIPRQLAKLHVTHALPQNVTPFMKLNEKLRSFSLSDSSTPIIGDLCTRFSILAERRPMEAEAKLRKITESLRPWNAQYAAAVQYPNHKRDWMMDACITVMPDFDYKRFTRWLMSVDDVKQLLSPPLCLAPVPAESKKPVVIDGDVLPHGTRIPEKPKRLGKQEVELKGTRITPAPANKPKVNAETIFHPRSSEDRGKKMVNSHPPKTTPEADEKKRRYEELKARKVALGTWVESMHNNNPDGRRSGAAPKESVEACKIRKVRNGTWKEPDRGSTAPKSAHSAPKAAQRPPRMRDRLGL